MIQQHMHAHIARKPHITTNTAADCGELAKRYEMGKYKIPLFQRDPLLWPIEQRRSFIARLWEGPEPVGSIVIYQVEDQADEHWFILDGLQRISSILDFQQSPDKYGIGDLAKVEHVLMSHSFPLQVRTYRDHQHAYLDFVRLQQNLQLTPFEQFFGKRSLLPAWSWFEKIEESIHRKMDRVMASYGFPDSNDRSENQKYWRHNLSLFLRFATGATNLAPWTISGKTSEGREGKVMEVHLADFLRRPEIKAYTEKKVDEWFNRVDNDRGLIWDAWEGRDNYIKGDIPTRTIVRFLHTVGVYCSINKTSPVRFQKFAISALGAANGDTQIWYTNKSGAQDKLTLAIDNLSNARTLISAGIADEDIFVSDSEQRGGTTKKITSRGFDAGHEKPISTHGPGPTAPEPTSRNRSKGNRHD